MNPSSYIYVFTGLVCCSSLVECQDLTFTTLAGNAGYGSNDGTGAYAQFHEPSGIAAGNSGELYIADTYNHTIRKVSPDGVVSTIAGLAWTPGTNDGVGAGARFNLPMGLAVDGEGNLFVADFGNDSIRKISTGGVVSTIAGGGGAVGFMDGTNGAASFNPPSGLAMDHSGNLYVADYWNNLIRGIRHEGSNWIVTTLAGATGNYGSDDGTNSNAHFYWPRGIAAASAGNLYVADTFNSTIRRLAPIGTNWVVTTVAGVARSIGVTDGTNAAARFFFPRALVVSTNGVVFVADSDSSIIRSVTPVGSDWVVSTIAGNHLNGSTDGTNLNTQFNEPTGIALDQAGTILVADSDNNVIRTIHYFGTNRVVETLVGARLNGGNPDGIGPLAWFSKPAGVVVDALGSVYVADTYDCGVRKIDSGGKVVTLAGFGGCGQMDGTNTAAQFNYPWGIAADPAGNLFLADTENNSIREMFPAGTNWVSTTLKDSTNNPLQFAAPEALAINSRGEIFVGGLNDHTIQKVIPSGSNWMVMPVAGLAGVAGSADGTNSDARFSSITGIAIDLQRNLLVADTFNHTIRKLAPEGTNWIVTTVAGLAGTSGSADGTNSDARFFMPAGLAFGASAELYVADSGNNTIRKLTPRGSDWVVDTVGGVAGSIGNADGTGSRARFYNPFGLTADGSGGLYVADMFNGTIRHGWTKPTLLAMRCSDAVALFWPLVADSFSLETASGLSLPMIWNMVTNGIVVSGNNFTVTNGSSQISEVYRLHQPGPSSLTHSRGNVLGQP